MAIVGGSANRINSLDQFRGYTVLGMFLVNFIGGFRVIAADYPIFKHWDSYCSYADTIMPHFFFAVGYAYRLTSLRRFSGDPEQSKRSWSLALFWILLGILIGGGIGLFHGRSELAADLEVGGLSYYLGTDWLTQFVTVAEEPLFNAAVFVNMLGYGLIGGLIAVIWTVLCSHRAYAVVLRRAVGLILVGLVLYGLERAAGNWDQLTELGVLGFFEKAFANWRMMQTLVHIAITTIWVMPVITCGAILRWSFLLFSGGLHVSLSWWFYYDWSDGNGVIDGGPLGFMTWTIPLLLGSFAYDWVASGRFGAATVKLLIVGALFMCLGYCLSCLDVPTHDKMQKAQEEEKVATHEGVTKEIAGVPYHVQPCPFMKKEKHKDMWTMNQHSGTVSYLVFAGGLSLFLYGIFVVVSDIWRFREGEGLSAAGAPFLLLGMILLVVGSVASVASIYGLLGPGYGENPVPANVPLSEWVNEVLQKPDGWTWAVLASIGLALLGWEIRRWSLGKQSCTGSLFRTLGTNALAAYIIHDISADVVKRATPGNSPFWFVLASFATYLCLCYIFLRYMEKHKMYLRL